MEMVSQIHLGNTTVILIFFFGKLTVLVFVRLYLCFFSFRIALKYFYNVSFRF